MKVTHKRLSDQVVKLQLLRNLEVACTALMHSLRTFEHRSSDPVTYTWLCFLVLYGLMCLGSSKMNPNSAHEDDFSVGVPFPQSCMVDGTGELDR